MSPKFFIFPCVISDEDFNLINQIREQLVTCHSDLTVMCLFNTNIRYVNIDHIVTDLSEVLRNRIVKGYRYNSYILNISIVKLDYILTVIRLDTDQANSKLATKIEHCLSALSQVLSNLYVDYCEDMQ